MASKIDWLDGGEVWNPLAGCTKTSPGCDNCYACRLVATRLKHMPDFAGLAENPSPPAPCEWPDGGKRYRWTGEVRLLPHKLEQPLRWRKPRRIFVVDKGDLFHELVPNEYIAAVYGVMAACPQHTFIVLTKRPERMVEWYRWYQGESGGGAGPVAALYEAADQLMKHAANAPWTDSPGDWAEARCDETSWPLPNVWLGVTCEDQQRADERIPLLLQTPAAVRWVSYEPGLAPVDLSRWMQPNHHHRDEQLARIGRWGTCVACPRDKHGMEYPERCEYTERYDHQLTDDRLHWIVIGCESGPKARPFDLAWARELRWQCKAAGVPCFTKQLPALFGDKKMRKSAELAELGWPVQVPGATMSASPFKSAAERADGLYHAYMHGWRAGAAGERQRAYSTLKAEQAAFESGHAIGKDVLAKAHAAASKLSRAEPT